MVNPVLTRVNWKAVHGLGAFRVLPQSSHWILHLQNLFSGLLVQLER